MIAFNFNLSPGLRQDAMRKGLLFTCANWLLKAIEQHQPNCSLALVCSVAYRLERPAKCQGHSVVHLTETSIYLN